MTATIGERLREARMALQRQEGIKPNRAAFARSIGISPPSLSDLESGESGAPSSATLMAIRNRGINPDYIMYGKGPKLAAEAIEHRLERQTLMGMIEELDDEECRSVASVVKLIIRRKQGAETPPDSTATN